MRQLTHTEKRDLEAKIKDEQERQQALREMYPGTPEDLKALSAETEFTLRSLWKYVFLTIILCLLTFNVFGLLTWQRFGYDQYLGPLIALMLLFNHIAYYFTTEGWKSIVMKTVAWVWIAFVFVYIYWIWVA